MKSEIFREINAIIAIAGREVSRAIKGMEFIAFSLVSSIIFIGILGGSLTQNLAGNLGYNYMQFILVGMVVMTLYQMTIGGVVSLIEDRENDFTQEIFVSPISRYSIIFGKIIGSSIISLFQLIGVFIVALFLRIPLNWNDVARLLLLSPILCLSAGSLGIFFIGFVRSPKTASTGSLLLVFPQMFLSGALIPVRNSTGLLGILTHIMPMTYSVDLARGIFYWGKPEYKLIVMYNPLINIIVSAAFFIGFSVVGTIFFTRAEQNK